MVAHLRGGRIASRRIAKDKGVVELDLSDKLARLLVIALGLAGKTDDNVGGDRGAVARLPDAIDKIDIFLRGISPVHCFQNFVGTGLQRQMHVLRQFRQASEYFDQILTKSDRMR